MHRFCSGERGCAGVSNLVVAQLVETMGSGGAEHLAVQLANYVANDTRCESHLIVLRGEGPMSARIEPGVHVHYLHFERAAISQPLAFVRTFRVGLRRIQGCLAENRVTVMQTHLPAANFWGLALCRQAQLRVLATVHNNQEFRYGPNDKSWKIGLRKLAYKQVIERVAATVAVSDAVRSSLATQLRLSANSVRKIVVIPNGVPLAPPVEPKRRTELRGTWGAGPGSHLVVSVGRLDAQKNFGDLVAAAAILGPTRDGLRFVIAGEGPGRAALEADIDARGLNDLVHLAGRIDDVPALFAAADVFVSTSLWEGLPLVVLEAMASGLPVVGNDIDGLRDLVRDGQSGRLVTPGRAELTAAAIGQLLADGDLRRQLGREGRRIVCEQFGFSRMARQVLDLYAAVADDALPREE